MEIKETIKNKDKFLCYCSKITFDKFKMAILSNNNSNLENICVKLNLASKCAACLPNIEDMFFQIKGYEDKISNVSSSNDKYNFIEKLKNLIDYLSGNKLISQNGHLPMLASLDIQTWLVVSNDIPSFMTKEAVTYKIDLLIFKNNGKKIKQLSQFIKPNNILRLCLNDFVPVTKDISTYYVKVTRTPTSKGFRGSTRPHFYYETKNSMASLHTQDGSARNNIFNIKFNKSNDRYFIFMINPNNKIAIVEASAQNYIIENKLHIPAKGSHLIEVRNREIFNDFIFKSTSNTPIKCYFIIADKGFKNLSVDHI